MEVGRDVISGQVGRSDQASVGGHNQQTSIALDNNRYDELCDDISEMKTDVKLLSREVSALVALRRDLDDLRHALANVLGIERDVERLKTWLFIAILVLAATGWLYTNLTVTPLEDRIVVLERQLERLYSWPYSTPTPYR